MAPPTSPTEEFLPGTLDLLVLKTLTLGAAHGYAIARHIQKSSADVLALEEGTLYPALHRLERRGWVAAEWGVSDANRRAKYYRLTQKGRAQLKVELAAWTRFAAAVEGVLGAAVGEPARLAQLAPATLLANAAGS